MTEGLKDLHLETMPRVGLHKPKVAPDDGVASISVQSRSSQVKHSGTLTDGSS